jgi:hypothetical protein
VDDIYLSGGLVGQDVGIAHHIPHLIDIYLFFSSAGIVLLAFHQNYIRVYAGGSLAAVPAIKAGPLPLSGTHQRLRKLLRSGVPGLFRSGGDDICVGKVIPIFENELIH